MGGNGHRRSDCFPSRWDGRGRAGGCRHIPPYLRAQFTRGRALLNAAEADHDTVEHDLNEAIDGFDTLGYPYWHAVAQTDLAAWLIDQQRGDEARPLLEHATAALKQLRAAPALTRAQALSPAATNPIAS